MKSSEYWKERFGELEKSLFEKSEKSAQNMEREFYNAQLELDNKIASWYGRIMANNSVSMAEARKMLTSKELAEFRWNVSEYIKHMQDNAISNQWAKQLENASARVHISRFEALKIETQNTYEKLYGNQLDELDKLAKSTFLEGYTKTAFEVQNGFNTYFDFASINESVLDKVIAKPWAADGKNFSSRIWDKKNLMVNDLHKELTRMVITGADSRQAVNALSKYVNKRIKSAKSAKSAADRLVMTETAYFRSESQKECFNELNVEKFEIVATLDSLTSSLCQGMDGQVFLMKDYVAGITAPPFHPCCRSVTVPYFDDEFTLNEQRFARGEDGNSYYVDGKMKYPEWKEKFVDKNLQKTSGGGIMKVTENERYSINSYISSESYSINLALRNKQPLDVAQQNIVSGLDSALAKLPKYEGTVYRSMSSEFLDDAQAFFESHQVGKYIKYDAFTSTSESVYDYSMDIQMVIKSKNAVDLRGFNPSEKEVLFGRNSTFYISKVEDNKFYMEEE